MRVLYPFITKNKKFILLQIIIFLTINFVCMEAQEFHHVIQFSNGRFEEPNLDDFKLLCTDSLKFNDQYDFSELLQTPLLKYPPILIKSENKKQRYFLILEGSYNQEYFHTEGSYKLKIILELVQVVKTQKMFHGLKKSDYRIHRDINYKVINGYFQYFRYKTLVYALLVEGKILKREEDHNHFWGNIYLKFQTVGVPIEQDYEPNLTVVINSKFRASKKGFD